MESEVGVCFSKIHRFGFYGREDTPCDISNQEVKLSNADDSVKAKIGKSRMKCSLPEMVGSFSFRDMWKGLHQNILELD